MQDARRILDLIVAVAESSADSSAGWPSGEQAHNPAGGHPPECRYCPLCQGIAMLHRSGPDVLDRVSELAAGLAAALRAMPADGDPADRAAEQGGDRARDQPAGGSPAPPGTVPPRTVPPSTVRIDITE